MADAYKRLTAAGQQIPASVTTMYTSPAGPATGTVIRNIEVVNTDAATAYTFALYLGGTTAAHLITTAAVLVPAGGKWQSDTVRSMSPSEVLSAIASVAAKLNIRVDGDETS
jgi:hypothetical protein